MQREGFFENCWDFLDCKEEIKQKCIVFLTKRGNECWLVFKGLEDGCGNIECIDCSWFKKNNPNFKVENIDLLEKEKTINCPMFNDYVRECMEYIDIVPEVYTSKFCNSVEKKYKKCPFFRAVKNIQLVCKMVVKCRLYKELSSKDFDVFLRVTNEYCLSENSFKCARLKGKQMGVNVPYNLLPDGSEFNNK